MNIKPLLFTISAILLITGCTHDEVSIGNSPNQYQKFYGGAFTEEIAAAHMMPDSSQIVLGTKVSIDMESTHYFLFSTDASGNMEWSKEIGGANISVASDMLVENDQIITLGHRNTTNGDQDIFLWKTDLEGVLIDSISLGISSRNEVSPKILSLSDGSAYVIAAHVVDNSNVIVDNVVYQISSTDYSLEWEAVYSTFSRNANVIGMQQVADDKIIWVGSETEDTDNDTVISLNLLNTAGSKINTTQIGLNNGRQDKAYSLKKDNSNFIIAGSTTDESGIPYGVLITFSYNNIVTLDNTIEIPRDVPYELLDVTRTSGSGYYVTGYQQNSADDQDIYIAELSRAGSVLWEATFGGSGFDQGKLIKHNIENDALLIYGNADLITNQSITILQTDAYGSLVAE